MEVDTEEDEVIQEMPVFLSQELAKSLFLLQYPLRPTERPYNAELGTPAAMRVKPVQKKVELEFDMHHNNNPHYDEGSQWPIKKVTLVSQSVGPKTNYAVGVIRAGQLHLTPLHAVCRMKPDLGYIDEADAKNKVEEEEDEEEEKEEDESLKPLMLKFKNKETEKSAAYRKLSHAYMKQMQDKEDWVNVTLFDKHTTDSAEQFEKLIAQSSRPLEFNVPAAEYIRYINPDVAASSATRASSSAPVRASSIADHVLTALRTVRVISFGQVCKMSQVTSAPGVEDALATLQREAHLVQGNWVVKSSAAYSGRAMTARNYILALFAKNRVVNREVVASVVMLDLEVLAGIFDELAVRRTQGGGWEFKLPTDHKFAQMFSLVAKSQSDSLAKLELQSRLQLETRFGSDVKEDVPRYTGGVAAPTTAAPSGSASVTHRASAPALADFGINVQPSAFLDVNSAVRDQLVIFLDSQFRKHGVCSLPYLERKLEAELASRSKTDPAVKMGAAIKPLFHQILDRESLRINDLYCRKSLNNPDVDRYRVIVATVFSSKSALKKSDVVAAVEANLKQDMPDNYYHRVMKEFAKTNKKGIWELKPGDYPD